MLAGGNQYVRLATPGYSYLSSNDPRAHFGLPKGVAIEHVEVVWPDGNKDVFAGVDPNRVVVLEKGKGR